MRMFLDVLFTFIMVAYAMILGLVVLAYTLWCYLMERLERGDETC